MSGERLPFELGDRGLMDNLRYLLRLFVGLRQRLRAPELTAEDTSTIDNVYGADEAAVLSNLRTRVAELEQHLKSV